MAEHRKEATVYFAVDSEDRYYIGSTHVTRYDDEYELIEFAEGMGIPLTNEYRRHRSNLKGNR